MNDTTEAARARYARRYSEWTAGSAIAHPDGKTGLRNILPGFDNLWLGWSEWAHDAGIEIPQDWSKTINLNGQRRM